MSGLLRNSFIVLYSLLSLGYMTVVREAGNLGECSKVLKSRRMQVGWVTQNFSPELWPNRCLIGAQEIKKRLIKHFMSWAAALVAPMCTTCYKELHKNDLNSSKALNLKGKDNYEQWQQQRLPETIWQASSYA